MEGLSWKEGVRMERERRMGGRGRENGQREGGRGGGRGRGIVRKREIGRGNRKK